MTSFEDVGVFIREKVWLENSLSQTFYRINTPTFSHLVILRTYPPVKMEQTECSETSAYKIQTPGNYPEESIQDPYLLEEGLPDNHLSACLSHFLC
jgi:hypothetical protein